MCLTSDAVYRIRDADAIFIIERKNRKKIVKNSKLFYTKYGKFTTNHCGSVRGTLWRIVSKYILFLRMFQTFYRRFYQNTTHHVMGNRNRADHDKSRYEAYSVKLLIFFNKSPICPMILLLIELRYLSHACA